MGRWRWALGYRERYRDVILAVSRFVDLKGLTTVGFYTPELDEVYVDVSLGHRAPGKAQGGLVNAGGGEGRLRLHRLIGGREPVMFAVLGAPGSGKTTLLRHTARSLCQQAQTGRRALPTLLHLRDHAAAIVGDARIGLPTLIARQLAGYGAEEPPGWFERQLRKGRCVVLLDGLDEVAHEDDRRAVAGWVETQLARYPGNDFVLTSRPHGFRSARIEGPVVLEVCEFTEEQVAEFVRSWYRAVERRDRQDGEGGAAAATAERRAAELLARLRESSQLREMATNPLLLTMITNIHRELGKLPGSRADLYAEICQATLGGRQKAKNLPTGMDADAKEKVLGELAFTMMWRKVRDLPRQDVLSLVRGALGSLGADMTAEACVADTVADGLLLEHEPGTYSFAHLTFQEYLAATHIHRRPELVQGLANNASDDWWRETTLLLAARAPVDAFVRACLEKSRSMKALALALDCLDECPWLAPEVRAELRQELDGVTVPRSAEQRERVGRLLLAGHVRHSVGADSAREVYPRPVSNRMYRLVLGRPGADEGDAARPAVLTREELAEFLGRLAVLAQDGPKLGLPTPAELARATGAYDAAAEERFAHAWVQEHRGQARRHQVAAPGTLPAAELDSDALTRAVCADFGSPAVLARLLLVSLAFALGRDGLPWGGKDILRVVGGDDGGPLAPVALDRALGLARVTGSDLPLGPLGSRVVPREDVEAALREATAPGRGLHQRARIAIGVLQRIRAAPLCEGWPSPGPPMGLGLSHALHRAFSAYPVDEYGCHVLLARELVARAGLGRGETWRARHPLSPAKVRGRVSASVAALRRQFPTAPGWMARSADALESKVWQRQAPWLGPADATALRVAALALAAEARSAQLACQFRHIAADVTMLERHGKTGAAVVLVGEASSGSEATGKAPPRLHLPTGTAP